MPYTSDQLAKVIADLREYQDRQMEALRSEWRAFDDHVAKTVRAHARRIDELTEEVKGLRDEIGRLRS